MNNSAVAKLLQEARQKALTDIGEKVTERAKQEAPVDTGHLKANIELEGPIGPMEYVAVVSNAPYSVYVEVGTKNQRANPFLARAIEAVSNGG